MNRSIKGAILIAAATFAAFTVSAQTDVLWLDTYETKRVIDTVAADSIDAKRNADYNVERREREFKEYAKPYNDKIELLFRMMDAAYEKKNKSFMMKMTEKAAGVSDKDYTALFHSYKKYFINDVKVTKKDWSKIDDGKIPKDFIDRVLLPQKDSLQEMINKFVPSPDVIKYNWRKEVCKIDDPSRIPPHYGIPMKYIQIKAREPNPNCLDNYLNGNLMWNESIFEDIRRDRDATQQSIGWEWMDSEEFEVEEIFFPERFSYNVHPSHPEYRLVKDHLFNEKGGLVRAGNIVDDHWDFFSIYDVLMNVFCKQDFLKNKYDINRSDKQTLEALKMQFGITDGLDERYKKNIEIYKASALAMGFASRDNDVDGYLKAKRAYDASRKVVLEYAYKFHTPQADNYIEQLRSDHKNDLRYLYKIERIDNTTFKIYYLNDKKECSCVALLKCFNTTPYELECKIELLPNEKITIRR